MRCSVDYLSSADLAARSPFSIRSCRKSKANSQSSTRNDGYKAGVPHHGEDVSTNCLPAVAAVCVLDRKACSTSELSLVVYEYYCHGLAQTRGTGRLQASHARAPGCLQRRHHHGGGRQEPAPNRVHQEQGCDRPFQDRSVWSVKISLTPSRRASSIYLLPVQLTVHCYCVGCTYHVASCLVQVFSTYATPCVMHSEIPTWYVA